MRIAIVGSGVSGLVCAHLLHARHDVVLYEADDRPGGHSHTHRVELPDATARSTPGSSSTTSAPTRCSAGCSIASVSATQPSDMSFSVSDRAHRDRMARHLAVDGVRPAAQRGPPGVPARCSSTSAGSTGSPVGCSRTRRPTTSRSRTCSPPTAGRPGSATGTSSRWARRSGRRTRRRSPGSRRPPSPASSSATGCCACGDQPRWRTVTGGSQTYVQAILAPLQAEGRVRLGTPVDKIRTGGGRRRTGGPGRSGVLRPCRRGHPQRPGPASAVGPRPVWSARRSVRSATNPIGPRSTPTPACCRATGGRGPAGTTTGCMRTRIGRHSPTTSTSSKASPRRRRCW